MARRGSGLHLTEEGRKKIKQGIGNVKNKVFGTPKKKQNFSSKTGTKTPNEKLKRD